ncbi:DNA polymerase V [Pseudomonas asturiensis]|uniref:DNA polymerase V n=1 Tax=Pseudomonas asturiensis TaxID=1190415 RepID=A0A1M7PTN9_9PSED|nr:DUF4113 domain-containing protein [Pseudomonas asturiensis]SHN20869.1 DNA polymerase V [Pseudomonas asturiensis]
MLERTVRELTGEPCIDLQEAELDRQAICTSRMFGERVTTLEAMREAVASYMHRATQKLRKQQSLTAVFRVAVLTSPFVDGPKYANSVTCYPPYPTDDVLLLTRAAMEGLEGLEVIWRDGYRYSKAEILLMDLRKRGEFTGDLFTPSQPARSDELMRVSDRINMKFGKNALHSGRMPLDATWAIKREMMSQSYTTSIHHLMRFHAI